MMKPIIPISLIFVLCSCGGESNSESSENSTENNGETNETEQVNEVEIDINLEKASVFPGDCEVKGNVVDVHSWKDLNGTNYFIRTINEIEYSQNDWGEVGEQYLWAFHYAENAAGEVKLLKETTDFVKECEFDLMMGHIDESLTLTDLDNDEIGEITFIYRLACTSDVSPSEQKLILLEDGNKYPLRGSTEVSGYGGDYESGEEFKSAPAEFLEHADKLWNKHKTEYEGITY